MKQAIAQPALSSARSQEVEPQVVSWAELSGSQDDLLVSVG